MDSVVEVRKLLRRLEDVGAARGCCWGRGARAGRRRSRSRLVMSTTDRNMRKQNREKQHEIK